MLDDVIVDTYIRLSQNYFFSVCMPPFKYCFKDISPSKGIEERTNCYKNLSNHLIKYNVSQTSNLSTKTATAPSQHIKAFIEY